MRKGDKRVFTRLTEKEYENFNQYLKLREQPTSEYVLMALAVLLKNKNVKVHHKKRSKGLSRILTVRCSDCVYDSVEKFAQEHSCSKADVVAEAIKEAIQG